MRRIPLALLLPLLAVPPAIAQAGSRDPSPFIPKVDISLGYANLRANAPPGVCDCFGLNGGYVSVGYKLKYWLSVAGEVTGSHAKDISPLGQDLTLMTYTAGPRIVFRGTRLVPFAQVLVGAAHGSDSYFPTANSYTTSATSFALNAGGGVDYTLNHRFAIRPVEVQYLRTSLPNGSSDYQNHLVLGAGIVFKFHDSYSLPHVHHEKAVAAAEAVPPPPPPTAPAPVVAEPVAVAAAPVPPPVPVNMAPPPPVVDDASFHDNVKDAFFDYDKSAIRPDAQQAIVAAAAYLNSHSDLRVLVGGYSDERGTVDYNLSLGERRAEAARDALVAAGVSADRLQVVSYGKGTQVCSAQDEECWQRNRRAAFQMKR